MLIIETQKAKTINLRNWEGFSFTLLVGNIGLIYTMSM